MHHKMCIKITTVGAEAFALLMKPRAIEQLRTASLATSAGAQET